MILTDLLKTKEFLDQIAQSVRNIIFAHFPKLTQAEREDVEQDVKLKIWRSLHRGKKISNLRSYLWKVVYTTSLDVIKAKGASTPAYGDEDKALAGDLDRLEIETPESMAEKNEMAAFLHKEILTLPENRKIPVELYLAGMNHTEIAAFLGWGENQVRHLLYRGIEDVVGNMKRKYGGEGGHAE